MLSLNLLPKSDLHIVEQLAHEIWPIHYTPIIGEKQVKYMLHKMYSLPVLEKQFDEGHQFFIIKENDKNIGYVSTSSTDNKNFFLHKFYILQNQQGKKLGEQLFNQLYKGIYQAETVRLYVNRQNYKSVNFYFKMGFKIERLNELDIGEGYFMSDFIMLWKALK